MKLFKRESHGLSLYYGDAMLKEPEGSRRGSQCLRGKAFPLRSEDLASRDVCPRAVPLFVSPYPHQATSPDSRRGGGVNFGAAGSEKDSSSSYSTFAGFDFD